MWSPRPSRGFSLRLGPRKPEDPSGRTLHRPRSHLPRGVPADLNEGKASNSNPLKQPPQLGAPAPCYLVSWLSRAFPYFNGSLTSPRSPTVGEFYTLGFLQSRNRLRLSRPRGAPQGGSRFCFRGGEGEGLVNVPVTRPCDPQRPTGTGPLRAQPRRRAQGRRCTCRPQSRGRGGRPGFRGAREGARGATYDM